jgi:hypothetical protein
MDTIEFKGLLMSGASVTRSRAAGLLFLDQLRANCVTGHG